MLHVSRIIRNMNIDEALARLDNIDRKSADIIRDVLLEAQDLAVEKHGVEFKSNLHIVRSFILESGNIKFVRQHARGRDYINKMRFTNYYVMLREGPAPALDPLLTSNQAAEMYLNELRSRTIVDGL